MASAISKRIVKPINELDLEHPEENQIYEELSPLLSKIHRQNREIQNQLELAKQQQQEFSLITENMQEGLIVIDKYTMILSANSSAWNLFRMDKVRQGEVFTAWIVRRISAMRLSMFWKGNMRSLF